MNNTSEAFTTNTTPATTFSTAVVSTSTLSSVTSTLSSVTSTLSSVTADDTSQTTFRVLADVGCESLVGRALTLSTTSSTTGTVVDINCDEFGHRPSGGISQLVCLNTSKWSPSIPSCEWSWDLTTQEKIIFGTAVAAGSFIIVIAIAICIAYFCCYKKRKDEDEKIYDSSYHESSPQTGYERPCPERESYPITYLAYQDINDGKYDGYISTGTLDKPWLGYIPRPKVTEGRFYN